MKKRLFKYIKFFVSIALILSLVAPSYASLSASDGSAFVTKSEFDSALADFNARLTTFETGINSKIDSQVTSYLDRNGIWSGADQTMYNDFFWARWYDSNAATGGYTPTCYGALTFPNAYSAGAEQNLLDKTICVVHDITKSGLCNVDFTVMSPGTAFGLADKRCIANWVAEETRGQRDDGAQTLYATLKFLTCDKFEDPASFVINNPKDKASFVITQYQRTSNTIQLTNNLGKTSSYFFVDKNKSLIVNYTLTLVAWFNSSVMTGTTQNWVVGEPGQFIDFEKISVY